MPAYVSALVFAMALGTVLLDVALAALVLALLTGSGRRTIFPILRAAAPLLVIVLSIASIAGTLVMQYAGALAPCILCWWQRVFMYPIALIALIAFFKNERFSKIADYVLAFSFLGALVALYQHLLQVLPQGSLIPCDPSNDCAVRTVFEFNFVTIPWMALTVFAVLFALALVARTDNSAAGSQVQ